ELGIVGGYRLGIYSREKSGKRPLQTLADIDEWSFHIEDSFTGLPCDIVFEKDMLTKGGGRIVFHRRLRYEFIPVRKLCGPRIYIDYQLIACRTAYVRRHMSSVKNPVLVCEIFGIKQVR